MSNARKNRPAPNFLALVVLAAAGWVGAATASAQDEPIRVPDPGGPRITADGAVVDRSGLRGLWFELESQFQENDFEGVRRTADEITRLAERSQLRRLTELAMAAVALAKRSDQAGAGEAAILAWDLADRFDPTLADVAFSRAEAEFDKHKYVAAVADWTRGVRRIFQNRIPRESLLYSVAVVSVLASVAAVLVFWLAICLRHISAFLHDVREPLEERLGLIGAAAIGIALLALPLILGFAPPYAVLFSMFLLWSYARPSERMMITVGQLVLAMAPAVLLWIASQASSLRSPIYAGAVALVERRCDPATIDRLEQLREADTTDAERWYLLGSLHRDAGRLEKAAYYFRKAMELDPKLVEAAVNLGVVYYLEGEVDQAANQFQRALETNDEIAEAHYNLNVVLNELSQFAKGSEHLDRATRLDPERVSRWISENTIQNADFDLLRARAKSAAIEGDVNRELRDFLLNPMTIAGVALALLAPILFVLRLRKGGIAGSCVKCGRAFCRRCKTSTESAIYCSQCVHIFLKKHGVAIDTKMAKVEEVNRHTRFEELRRRFSSLLLPGFAQILSAQPIRGFALIFAFSFFVIATVLVGELYRPVVLGAASVGRLGIAAGLLAAFFWVLANLRIFSSHRAGVN